MNGDQIKDIVNRVPISLLLFLFLGYLALDYHSFETDDASPLMMKKKEVAALKDARLKLDAKLKEANNFVKSLEVKKQDLRKLAIELQGMKESLSERSDVPAFMKLVFTEAKKLGVVVNSLKPAGSKDKEFYTETTFNMTFRGVFAQVAGFLDRMANVSEIVRVEKFAVKPLGPNKGKFVMLDGSLDIMTYKYRGSSADNVGKVDPFAPSSNKGGKPETTPQKPKEVGT